jgi:hypothetical protein
MLASKRPATTVHVYDAVKTRMTEALQIARQYVTLDFRGVFIEPLLSEASYQEKKLLILLRIRSSTKYQKTRCAM